MIETWDYYRKKQLQKMRPYVQGEDMTGISVSDTDKQLEILEGGFIAVNANDPTDKWYVSKKFHEDNYEFVAGILSETKTGLTFGQATHAAKQGKKVSRSGWNGVGMYAVIMPGYPDGIAINEVTANVHHLDIGTKLVFRPYWALWTAQKDIAMWAPSGSDSLAEDWCIVD